MQDQPKAKWHIWRNALTLLCGILTGVALAVARPMWRLFQMWFDDRPIETGTYGFWAMLYIIVPAMGAIVVALAATMIWWAGGRNFRRYLVNALGLGFVLAGMAVLTWIAITSPQDAFDRELIRTFVVYGLMGAIAGAVTWLVSHPRRKNFFIALD